METIKQGVMHLDSAMEAWRIADQLTASGAGIFHPQFIEKGDFVVIPMGHRNANAVTFEFFEKIMGATE